MEILVSIGKVAKWFGVSVQTVRNWGAEKKLTVYRTMGGHRRFDLQEINKIRGIEEATEKKTIIYTRVSSQDQKEDLERQTIEIEEYCKENKIERVEIIKDIGSGINYKKKGLKKLINEIVEGKVGKLVVSFRDRLLRFGNEILLQICSLLNVEVVVLNDKENKNFEEQLVEDVLTILTVFCSKVYGKRSHRKRMAANA